jgi:hypothetical protein
VRRVQRVETKGADGRLRCLAEDGACHLLVEADRDRLVRGVIPLAFLGVDKVDDRDGRADAAPPAGEGAGACSLVGREAGEDALQRLVREGAQTASYSSWSIRFYGHAMVRA